MMQYPLKAEPQRYRGSGFPPYIRRLLKWKQMDLEYTLWQMYLMCVNPKTVYLHTMYRKQTKNRWARDDPAFVVITCALIAIVAALYGAFYAHSAGAVATLAARAVVVDFLGVGALVSTAAWVASNRFLRGAHVGRSHAVEQRVELLYAFDVHCNAFFPLFVTLYCVQLVLSPALLARGFLPRLLSCALYAASLSYYHYCVFVGFNALPFLDNTVLFLYPIAAIAVATPLLFLFGFNPTRFVLSIYFPDVLG